VTHTPTLKPCPNPWCEADEREGDFSPEVRHTSFGNWQVCCTSCQQKGPVTTNEPHAITAWNTRTVEAGGVQELAEALREIRDMKPREYTGPEFDREASDACPDCIKYQGHPILQGICDEHRRPFFAREDHDKFEEQAKGSRCYLIASAALSKWEASK